MRPSLLLLLLALNFLGCLSLGKNLFLRYYFDFGTRYLSFFRVSRPWLEPSGIHLLQETSQILPNNHFAIRSTIARFLSRFVHFPESFWSARAHCKTFGGSLLSLANVRQVHGAVGQEMEGNAGEFRIDGWAHQEWFEG